MVSPMHLGSLNFEGDTNPVLFELCHKRDFSAISWWTRVPIFPEILKEVFRLDTIVMTFLTIFNKKKDFHHVKQIFW